MSRLTIVVAATKSNGIGVNGSLPWRLPKELKYFSDATTSTSSAANAGEPTPNVVIMGRKSWESIPPKRRPLPRRFNVVISRDAGYDVGTKSANVVLKDSLKSAFALLPPSSPSSSSSTTTPIQRRAFIIGGATLYTESLALPPSPSEPYVDRILLTRINEPPFACDVFMPDFIGAEGSGSGEGNGGWRRETHEALRGWVGFEVPEGEQEENGVKYEFQMWVRD